MKILTFIVFSVIVTVVVFTIWDDNRKHDSPLDPVQEGVISAIEDARDGIDKDVNPPSRYDAPPEGWDGKG